MARSGSSLESSKRCRPRLQGTESCNTVNQLVRRAGCDCRLAVEGAPQWLRNYGQPFASNAKLSSCFSARPVWRRQSPLVVPQSTARLAAAASCDFSSHKEENTSVVETRPVHIVMRPGFGTISTETMDRSSLHYSLEVAVCSHPRGWLLEVSHLCDLWGYISCSLKR